MHEIHTKSSPAPAKPLKVMLEKGYHVRAQKEFSKLLVYYLQVIL